MIFPERSTELLKKGLRYLFQLSIIGYLLYQLYTIGITRIITSLPTNPIFYLLYFVIYFSLPIAEVLIYKLKWPITFRNSFSVFIQKKVLNSDVIGYSGELYLFQWAKKDVGRPAKEVLHFIKDNNILSSVASTLITLVLLIFFISQGYININSYIENITATNWIFIGTILFVAAFLIVRFRKYIISMNRSDSFKIFSLHAFRIIFINVLQIIQWKIGRPEIAYSVWFTFSAVQILASRIPFLPSTDALFVSIALEMSNLVSVPKEAIVGILTANLILKRIMNVLSYFASGYFKKRNPVIVPVTKESETKVL